MIESISLSMNIIVGVVNGILAGSLLALVAAILHAPVAVLGTLAIASGLIGGVMGLLSHHT